MTGPKRKIAGLAAAAAAVTVILYLVLVNILVSAALVPSFMRRLEAFERITEESYAALAQVPAAETNRRSAREVTDEWLRETERRRLQVRTDDGYELVAEQFPADEESHKWVLLLHGYTGWKEEMYPFACWYHGEGYHVIAPDLRCQGESEGDFIGMGWTDHYDCRLWLEEILAQDEQARIVIHGQSMGAATALMMTGEEWLPSGVAAVVSDCAYTDAWSMFGEKITEWFHLPAFPLVDTARLMLLLRGGYDLKDASALEAVKKSDTPTLFIHGDADAMFSVQMSRELYEAAACKKEILIVGGAGHAQAPELDPDAYYCTIRTFLEEAGLK